MDPSHLPFRLAHHPTFPNGSSRSKNRNRVSRHTITDSITELNIANEDVTYECVDDISLARTRSERSTPEAAQTSHSLLAVGVADSLRTAFWIKFFAAENVALLGDSAAKCQRRQEDGKQKRYPHRDAEMICDSSSFVDVLDDWKEKGVRREIRLEFMDRGPRNSLKKYW